MRCQSQSKQILKGKEMNAHLERLVELRLHYAAGACAILAERRREHPNCLVDELLGHWGAAHEAAYTAKTKEQLRHAGKLLKYAGATADSLLDGNSDAACWTLQALIETLDDATE